MAIVDPTIYKGSCPLVSSGVASIATCGRASPCRDFVISVNPDGGIFHSLLSSSFCDVTFWVGAGDGLTIWVVAMGSDLHTLWATMKQPLAQALWFLLWLLSLQPPWSGCSGSASLDGVISHQLEGRSSLSTFSSVKVVKGSIALHSSCTPPANWQGLPRHGSWPFSTQYCRDLAYAKVFCGCFMW